MSKARGSSSASMPDPAAGEASHSLRLQLYSCAEQITSRDILLENGRSARSSVGRQKPLSVCVIRRASGGGKGTFKTRSHVRYENGKKLAAVRAGFLCAGKKISSYWDRTNDLAVNSRTLCQLS